VTPPWPPLRWTAVGWTAHVAGPARMVRPASVPGRCPIGGVAVLKQVAGRRVERTGQCPRYFQSDPVNVGGEVSDTDPPLAAFWRSTDPPTGSCVIAPVTQPEPANPLPAQHSLLTSLCCDCSTVRTIAYSHRKQKGLHHLCLKGFFRSNLFLAFCECIGF